MAAANFGRNVRFTPRLVERPRDKNGVLACLVRHRGRNIRAIGSLHSWSEAAAGDDVVLDLRGLNATSLHVDAGGRATVEVEAGVTIDAVHAHLAARGYTLPAYAIIGRQTIAGAIGTATHGSGRPSVSHFVTGVRVAAYDPETRSPRLYEWTDATDGVLALRAARCAIGCMGVLLSVTLPVEPRHLIEERTQWYDRVEEVIAREGDWPRQQFYLVPWVWRWYAQHRRPIAPQDWRPSLGTRFQRGLRQVGVDVLMNGAIRAIACLGWRSGIRSFYRNQFPAIARPDLTVIDESLRLLTMRHDLYRHIEMELFVPERHVARAAAFVEWVLRGCAGEVAPLPEDISHDDFGMDVVREAASLRGSYVHDYLITFRKVLPDDTLISMTSGGEARAWYAISLITYQREYGQFLKMASLVARAMAAAYRARPHWGKICPLDTATLDALYPDLPRFRACCAAVDPDGAFVNAFAARALGFRIPA